MSCEDYYEIIRINIKRYRKYADLSQEQLANRINKTKSVISNIESEVKKSHTSIETYCHISEALGIPFKFLLEKNINKKIDILPKIDIKNDSYNNFDYEVYKNAIATNIKKIRILRNLTQEELAERIDITPHYLSEIEIKRKNPTLSTLCKISNILNVELYCFFEK